MIESLETFMHVSYCICRTRLDGDVQLLVLQREELEELFVSYPEEQELIMLNVLTR
jgi:hypothetical protein